MSEASGARMRASSTAQALPEALSRAPSPQLSTCPVTITKSSSAPRISAVMTGISVQRLSTRVESLAGSVPPASERRALSREPSPKERLATGMPT